MTSRRGIALLMVLMALVLAGTLAALSARAATVRSRSVAALRWEGEGAIVVASGLAVIRLQAAPALAAMADGDSLQFAPIVRGDGWAWSGSAVRRGAVIRLLVSAERRGADSSLVARAVRSLLLVRNSADTVRVLVQQPRF